MATKTYIRYSKQDRNNRSIYEHVLVAEKALGKPLPDGAVVHHVDGNGENNTPSNLVICPSQKYHLMLHQRMAAKQACSNPSWRKCYYCKKYDDPKNLYLRPKGDSAIHVECMRLQNHKKVHKSEGGSYHMIFGNTMSKPICTTEMTWMSLGPGKRECVLDDKKVTCLRCLKIMRRRSD